MALILLFLFLVGVYYIEPNILWQVRSMIVASIANFIADILDHERVQAAAASAMVRGMNETSDQPDLANRMSKIYVAMQSQEDVSRQLGEQFPKVASAFLAGAAAGLRKKEQKPQVDVKKAEIAKKEATPEVLPNTNSPLGQWGLLFRGMHSENKSNKEKSPTKEEISDRGTAGLFPIMSMPSFQSCGSDNGIETDKDSAANSIVDSSHADDQVIINN
jgi:hypothetical protein